MSKIYLVHVIHTSVITYAFANEKLAYENISKMIKAEINVWDINSEPILYTHRFNIESMLIHNDVYSISNAVSYFNNVNSTVIYGNQYSLVAVELEGKIELKNSSGCSCKECKDYNPYAEPNQVDGSFICRSCKMWLGL